MKTKRFIFDINKDEKWKKLKKEINKKVLLKIKLKNKSYYKKEISGYIEEINKNKIYLDKPPELHIKKLKNKVVLVFNNTNSTEITSIEIQKF